MLKGDAPEFGLEFPNYNEVSPDGKTLMDYDNNWTFFETEHDLHYPKQHTSKSRKNLKELSLKNLLIIKIMVYANGIGDPSVKFFYLKRTFIQIISSSYSKESCRTALRCSND